MEGSVLAFLDFLQYNDWTFILNIINYAHKVLRLLDLPKRQKREYDRLTSANTAMVVLLHRRVFSTNLSFRNLRSDLLDIRREARILEYYSYIPIVYRRRNTLKLSSQA